MSSKILHHPEIGHIPSRWPTHKPCGVPLIATCHNSARKNLNIEFYAHMGIRCGQVDSTIQYLAEFHACYPKEPWIWKIQALEEESDGTKQLTPEFLEFMQAQSERFNQAINVYKNNPLPLYYLAMHFRRQVKDIWQWRHFYRLPIHIESGHPQVMRKEFENLRAVSDVMLDYLALLILNHLGFLEKLLQEFDILYISQSLFDEIQQNVIDAEDTELWKLWDLLRHSSRVRFVTTDVESCKESKLMMEEVIGVPMRDTLLISREKGYVLCCGDERYKRIAGMLTIKVTGIYAILERLRLTGAITDIDVSRTKLELIEENHSFISFNADDMINLARPNGYVLDQKLYGFFSPIFDDAPNYMSFINVYVAFICHLIQSNIQTKIILPWLAKYVEVFQTLYTWDHMSERFPKLFGSRKTFSVENGVNATTKDLCLLSLAHVYTLIYVLCDNPEQKLLISSISKSVTHVDFLKRYYNEILPDTKRRAESIRKQIRSKLHKKEPLSM